MHPLLTYMEAHMKKGLALIFLLTVGMIVIGCSEATQTDATAGTKQGAMTPDGKKGGGGEAVKPAN